MVLMIAIFRDYFLDTRWDLLLVKCFALMRASKWYCLILKCLALYLEMYMK